MRYNPESLGIRSCVSRHSAPSPSSLYTIKTNGIDYNWKNCWEGRLKISMQNSEVKYRPETHEIIMEQHRISSLCIDAIFQLRIGYKEGGN